MDLLLSVPRYDPERGVVAPSEGGTVRVVLGDDGMEIHGDAAGLRDLARWCLALSDALAPDGSHIHLDPDVGPLSAESEPLLIARHDGRAT